VLTQLARVEGLRGRFEAGPELVREAESLGGAETRVELERGRLYRSAGEPDAALPCFERAFELGLASGNEVLAADAAHMAAIVADHERWTARGAELAASSDDPEVRYWLGPLYNNLGWHHFEAGEYEQALAAFELALSARRQDPAKPYLVEVARYAIGKALRALGRADEAIVQLEQAVAWATDAGVDDSFFHEELAEDYAAVGRADDARREAVAALALLGPDEPDRAARLSVLAETT
jgi:tetratricopeptide (TPR) repeat protein